MLLYFHNGLIITGEFQDIKHLALTMNCPLTVTRKQIMMYAF